MIGPTSLRLSRAQKLKMTQLIKVVRDMREKDVISDETAGVENLSGLLDGVEAILKWTGEDSSCWSCDHLRIIDNGHHCALRPNMPNRGAIPNRQYVEDGCDKHSGAVPF